MGACIENDYTINALVGFFAWSSGDTCPFTEDPKEYAQILINENYRSVNHRYQEHTPPRKTTYSSSWQQHAKKFQPVEILRLCATYDYQACETDNYHTTFASRLIHAIRWSACQRLNGYASAMHELILLENSDQSIPCDEECWELLAETLAPIERLALCDRYECRYSRKKHADSYGHTIFDRIRLAAITQLEGYEQAGWGLYDSHPIVKDVLNDLKESVR